MSDTKDTRTVSLPVPPQVLAMDVYINSAFEVQRRRRMGEVTEAQMTEAMRNIVIGTIECACRAQREALAVLFEMLAEASPDIRLRQVSPEVVGIIRGEVKPQVVAERDAVAKIVLPGQGC